MHRRITLFLILAMTLWAGASCDKLSNFGKKKEAEKPGAAPQTAAQQQPAATAAGFSLDVFTDGKETIKLAEAGANNWTAQAGAKTFSIEKDTTDTYFLMEDGKVKAKGQFKDEKLKLVAEDGAFFMTLKIKPDKIKVTLEENGEPWDIKLSSDKVKVKRGDKEYGKVKFKPDTGKLKAKDAAEKVMAESRDAGRLAASPAACLIPGLDASRRTLLMLLLFALGK